MAGVIQRVWMCVEPWLIVRVLATPLRPVSILVVVALSLVASLWRRPALAKMLWRVGEACLLVLMAAVLTFGMAGFALARTGLNPTTLLRGAPFLWALLGPVPLLLGYRLAGVGQLSGWRALFERTAAKEQGRVKRLVELASLGFLAFGLVVLCGRPLTHNSQSSLIEFAYDLFEFFVPDQVIELASDECLMARVLEYGVPDEWGAGRDAAAELSRRGGSAVDGIASALDQVREGWPPEPNTVRPSAIQWGLAFLQSHEADAEARAWDDIPWDRDLSKLNSYPLHTEWRY